MLVDPEALNAPGQFMTDCRKWGKDLWAHLLIETAWINPRPAVAVRSLEIRLDLPMCGASWNFQNRRSFAVRFAILLRRNKTGPTIVCIRGDRS